VSTSDRLPDRREVAAGTRAYSVGFEDGRFYANGWHILGEMGGIWTPPLKLADGVWFGVDDEWTGPATKFTSGRGYVRYDLPSLSGLALQRTDFVPDGRRAALYGLRLANREGQAKTVTVKVDVHSELLSAYPWGWTTPSAATDLQDTVTYADGALVFQDQGTPAGREPHDWAALVASPDRPIANEVGGDHRGPQPGTVCHDGDQTAPKGCDDGPFGKGTGGELKWRLDAIRAHLKETNTHLPEGHVDRFPKLVFDRKCERTISDMLNYRYPERKGQVVDLNHPELPMKKDDHGPEALGRFFAGRHLTTNRRRGRSSKSNLAA